jgi:hypothetical protein
MDTTYHYEFDNILDIQNIMYKISIPRIKGAMWTKEICYAPLESVTIRVMVDDLLLHELIIDENLRSIMDDITKTYMNNFTNTSSRINCYIPLFPYDVIKTFGYIQNPCVKYKVICDVKINKDIKIQNYCIPDNKTVKPILIGKLEVEEINNEQKIIIEI